MGASQSQPSAENTESEPSALADLLARAEAAEGPDRELDADIQAAVEGGEIVWLQTRYTGEGYPAMRRAREWAHSGFSNEPCHHVTASLDAALALCERVLPGCFVGMQQNRRVNTEGPEWSAWVEMFVERKTEHEEGFGPTPAIALLSAMLKAKIAEAAHV